ncbi:hypothetical protein FHU38_003031 [Saccharomonospora amisosensis]|uniref:DUF3093 domain-containing protein n=1 Tax=Saccharomonospora amisosensis TaxID=1128677 RepID=A0A7X5ZRC3_9PSEU|nr:DUF3093 domain-containing protein [Saccharomonospora amisosensis]NIJ12687.1 hypothetical protein [Saccharomonospora amisosensis]
MNARARTRQQPSTLYVERLYIPWWGWPLPLIGAALLAAEIHMGYPGVRAWLPYVILLPLVALILVGLGRIRVSVTGGAEPEFWVGDAHLPVRYVDRVEIIGKQHKRKALGPELDPAAFLVHRGWVPTLLRVWLADPDDPTPYWVVSTRHPERLAAVLREHGGEH